MSYSILGISVGLMVAGGVLWCVMSVRAACIAALGTLTEHLRVVAQARAAEVAYLQRLVDSLNQQVLALADQSVQARLSYQIRPHGYDYPMPSPPVPEPQRASRNPMQEYRPRSEDDSIEQPES